MHKGFSRSLEKESFFIDEADDHWGRCAYEHSD